MSQETRETVYLSTGSNLGDREANLLSVIKELPPDVEVIRSSRVYQTKPWGYLSQPDFLNQVLQVETDLQPQELITYLKKVERKIGRIPSFLWGPRLVDIDILSFGNRVIKQDRLEIPHPRIKERAFVLVPLAEIAPDLVLPGEDKSVKELMNHIDTAGVALLEGNQDITQS